MNLLHEVFYFIFLLLSFLFQLLDLQLNLLNLFFRAVLYVYSQGFYFLANIGQLMQFLFLFFLPFQDIVKFTNQIDVANDGFIWKYRPIPEKPSNSLPHCHNSLFLLELIFGRKVFHKNWKGSVGGRSFFVVLPGFSEGVSHIDEGDQKSEIAGPPQKKLLGCYVGVDIGD